MAAPLWVLKIPYDSFMHDPYPRPAVPVVHRKNYLCWWNLSVPQHQPRPGQFLVQRPFFWSRIGYTSVWSPHIVILQHTRVKSEKLHTSEKNILFRLDGGTGNHVTTLPHTSNVLLFFAFIYIPQYVHNLALVWWNCCAILVDLIYGTSFIFATDLNMYYYICYMVNSGEI